MDFGALLHYAKQKNDAVTKVEQNKYYSTKYAPPKKESKESKQLSSNIQKFLKKREAEESERKKQEREKLNNLLAMRDEKSKNKIRKMLKVTKSANKSVLEDAKDCDNTTGMDGDGEQHDGDDYGYVSNEANAFYQKYIEKVKDVQEDKGFAPSRPQSLRDLSGTKERVKAAITREREEAKTHTRQRLSTATSSKSGESSVARSYSTSSKTLYNPEAERRAQEEEQRKQEEKEREKRKMKRPAQPPPMDFQALLRLAEKKQHEPVAMAAPEKKKEPERLLSAREKREQEERQRYKEQRAQRDRAREADAKQGTSTGKEQRNGITQAARMEPNGRIPKLNKSVAIPGKPEAAARPASSSSVSETKVKLTSDSLKRPTSSASQSSSNSSSLKTTTKSSSNGSNGCGSAPKRAQSSTNNNKAASASSSSSLSSSNSSSKPAAKPESRNPYAAAVKAGVTREFPPREPVAKTRAFPPSDVQRSAPRRPLPSGDTRGGRGASSSQAPSRRQPEMGNKRRIYDDDDESEYDSELDDFIDDGDCEEDISSHIRDIFGYDKRRYRDLDDDDDQMESSFAQVQREELISKKLGERFAIVISFITSKYKTVLFAGLQEDLEDMRMEALHKKNKIAKKRTRQ
ncbi:hypothetical protein KR093_009530 [Drosophila rubida]|uniref:Protein SPT2 homolog n=1 Tax=Drosophila rubida TaxID=30044 RepID=A0AAD4KBG8_9MUSC|nr:hypothetical protein KR093_009530 [Drosophila rubida]